MSTHYVIPTWDVASLPVAGSSERFPVRRIFCVGRNYLEHQKEMGSTEREEPFFFCKAPHGLVAVNEGENKGVHYGLMTQNYHWETELVAVLSKYVVLARTEPGCRNIDLCASVAEPGQYLVIEKWDSPESQRAHFDSPTMVEMATSCSGLLAGPPRIELWDGPSAHDLR